MKPIAITLEAYEAAAATATAMALALGVTPEQGSRATLIALRALPKAAASLQDMAHELVESYPEVVMWSSTVFEPLYRVSTPRARGGWRQRLLDDGASDTEIGRCHSFGRHVRSWAQGHISSPVLWDLCEGMILDGQTPPALVNLVACAHTIVDRNCNFNLMRLFNDRSKLGDLIRRIDGDGGVSCMVLPSTFSRWFHSIDRPKFLNMWGADANILERFWTSLLSSQEGREYRQIHPGIRNKTPFDLRHAIRVTIHEDATPFTKGKVQM